MKGVISMGLYRDWEEERDGMDGLTTPRRRPFRRYDEDDSMGLSQRVVQTHVNVASYSGEVPHVPVCEQALSGLNAQGHERLPSAGGLFDRIVSGGRAVYRSAIEMGQRIGDRWSGGDQDE